MCSVRKHPHIIQINKTFDFEFTTISSTFQNHWSRIRDKWKQQIPTRDNLLLFRRIMLRFVPRSMASLVRLAGRQVVSFDGSLPYPSPKCFGRSFISHWHLLVINTWYVNHCCHPDAVAFNSFNVTNNQQIESYYEQRNSSLLPQTSPFFVRLRWKIVRYPKFLIGLSSCLCRENDDGWIQKNHHPVFNNLKGLLNFLTFYINVKHTPCVLGSLISTFFFHSFDSTFGNW